MEGASALAEASFYCNDGGLVGDNLAFDDYNLAFECDILSQASIKLSLRSVLLAVDPHLLAFGSFFRFSHNSLPLRLKNISLSIKVFYPTFVVCELVCE